jgi:dTDP-4-dehydrorhamnose 3,5-epimerase-like enzyme
MIAGVRLIGFNFHTYDGGDFHEIARITGNSANFLEGFEIRQINRSRFNLGLVKAFHLHMNQDEVWAVHPLDRLLLGLVDVRKGSETEGVSMRLLLGAEKPSSSTFQEALRMRLWLWAGRRSTWST